MAAPSESVSFISNAWEVFLLFAIPVGGGIPAGVVLAKSRGLSWQIMTVLYFISDVALACVFEPLLKVIIHLGKNRPFVARVNEAMKKSMNQTISRYGVKPNPFMLILISFGVDPMTGRATALAAGHGILSGWTIAILGDLIFFGVVMVSTLLLNNVLGDGTWTAIIIMVLMTVIPSLVNKIKERNRVGTI